MLSMPPATMMSADPAVIRSWPSITAFMPEPHTLLTVVAPVASGRPAPRAAWRAGAWPWPAGRTQPIRTSSMRSGARRARSTAVLITVEPRRGAAIGESSPWNRPSGVRTEAAMTTGSLRSLMVVSCQEGAGDATRELNVLTSHEILITIVIIKMRAPAPIVKHRRPGSVDEIAQRFGIGAFDRAHFIGREAEASELVDRRLRLQERMVGSEQQAARRHDRANRRHRRLVGGAHDVEIQALQGASHSVR